MSSWQTLLIFSILLPFLLTPVKCSHLCCNHLFWISASILRRTLCSSQISLSCNFEKAFIPFFVNSHLRGLRVWYQVSKTFIMSNSSCIFLLLNLRPTTDIKLNLWPNQLLINISLSPSFLIKSLINYKKNCSRTTYQFYSSQISKWCTACIYGEKQTSLAKYSSFICLWKVEVEMLFSLFAQW